MKTYTIKVTLEQSHLVTIEAHNWDEAAEMCDNLDIKNLSLDEPQTEEITDAEIVGES